MSIFPVQGRLEKVEDALYNSSLNFSEVNYPKEHALYKFPTYEFTVKSGDSTYSFEAHFEDCQSIYALAKAYNNFNCHSSQIRLDRYNSDHGAIDINVAAPIFEKTVVSALQQQLSNLETDYYWGVIKTKDSVYVKVFNQDSLVRKLYVYSINASNGFSLSQVEYFHYRDSQTYHYKRNAAKSYQYIESKEVTTK